MTMSSPMPPADHLGDMISALLDGELTPGELAAAEGHLTGCESCRAELEETATARHLVRDLPPVEPPFAFFRHVQRTQRWRRPAAWLAVAASVVAVVAIGVSPRDQHVAPPVGRFVEAHATASPGGDLVSNLGPPSVLPASFQP